MGNSCTHAADAVAHLVTEEEVREAVRSIEDWQTTQATAMRNGGPGNNRGPLLQRVGGPDVVKKVVELFYKKLYGDPRLILFLHDQDILHLRAKQSAFISWLFGPPNMPYLGRSVRIAHLRIIKQRGFCGDDFDAGMGYFEQAMEELGAPEVIIGEVMRRIRPFKDAFFTPSAKDGEEEGRWAAEEREKAAAAEEEARRQQLQQQEQQAYHERERKLQVQITLAHRVAEEEAEAEGEGEGGADAAVMAALAASLSTHVAAMRPPSRSPQCPFTGGRLSRPDSRDSAAGRFAAASTSGTLAAAAAVASPAPRTPRTPPAVAVAGPPSPTAVAAGSAAGGSGGGSSRVTSPRLTQAAAEPGSPVAAVSTESTATPPRSPGASRAGAAVASGGSGSLAVASSRPTSQSAARPESSSSNKSSVPAAVAAPAAVPAAAEALRVSSPTTPSVSTPAAVTDRPGTATAPAPLTPAAAVPLPGEQDPLAEFEAEIEAIERAYSPDSGKGDSQSAPLLPPALESSSSGTRRTAAVC